MRHPATAIAILALLVATAGGAFAAGRSLIPGSDIKPHSIPLSALAPATIKALRGQRGPSGPAGPTGATGAQGPSGTPGSNGTFDPSKISRVVGPQVSVLPGEEGTATATCPAGQVAIGGGGGFGYGFSSSLPSSPGGANPPTSWVVFFVNPQSFSITIEAIAVCASP